MNLIQMAKQMKDMQGEMKKIQAALAGEQVTGTGAKGNVIVVMNGAMEIQSVKLDPKLLEKPDAGQLEGAFKEAFGSALKQAQKLAASKVSHLTGGLGLSNLFGR